MLNQEELERYARHILLRDVGGAGQQKLKSSKVLVIGAGGLGSPLLAYLAAAGVGILGVVDDDVVSLSNLQRQILHDTEALDEPKVQSASHALSRINPHVEVQTHQARLGIDNGLELISHYDLVVDGSDNFDTRYLVAELCEKAAKPLITAAVGLFDGSITTLKPYESNEKGDLNPRYIDLFPEKPAPGAIPSCAEAGVLGALTGVIGSMQAVEVIKELVGFGEGLVGRLVLYDSRSARFETIKYRRRPS